MTPASTSSTQKLFGCLTRRERWGLSWRGWLAILVLVALVGGTWARLVHPFLAQTQRVETRVLVVEGWVPLYVLRAAVAEFQAGHYDKIYTTGGPIVGSGGYSNDFNTYASLGAEDLAKVGLPGNLAQMVPCHINGRDRTYSSALALREYFQTNGLAIHSLNVLTEDAHARRTRMLFQDAFAGQASVGVIAVPNPDYDAAHWWRYSAGVREILGESIAWVYAAFIFHPPKPADSAAPAARARLDTVLKGGDIALRCPRRAKSRRNRGSETTCAKRAAAVAPPRWATGTAQRAIPARNWLRTV